MLKGNLTSPYLQTAVLHRASNLTAQEHATAATNASGGNPSPAASSLDPPPLNNRTFYQHSSSIVSACWTEMCDADGLGACSVLRVLSKDGVR